MPKIAKEVQAVMEFFERRPSLDGSNLLKKESAALQKALNNLLAKAGEIELSLQPGYAETENLVEGTGKPLCNKDFMREFSHKHLSKNLNPSKADKKARQELLKLAAQDGKLDELRKALDPQKKYRDMLQDLMKRDDAAVKKRVMSMKPVDFRGIVTANGFEAPETKSGAISTAKSARAKVLKQILNLMENSQYLDNFGSSD